MVCPRDCYVSFLCSSKGCFHFDVSVACNDSLDCHNHQNGIENKLSDEHKNETI